MRSVCVLTIEWTWIQKEQNWLNKKGLLFQIALITKAIWAFHCLVFYTCQCQIQHLHQAWWAHINHNQRAFRNWLSSAYSTHRSHFRKSRRNMNKYEFKNMGTLPLTKAVNIKSSLCWFCNWPLSYYAISVIKKKLIARNCILRLIIKCSTAGWPN